MLPKIQCDEPWRSDIAINRERAPGEATKDPSHHRLQWRARCLSPPMLRLVPPGHTLATFCTLLGIGNVTSSILGAILFSPAQCRRAPFIRKVLGARLSLPSVPCMPRIMVDRSGDLVRSRGETRDQSAGTDTHKQGSVSQRACAHVIPASPQKSDSPRGVFFCLYFS